jgi:exodeoxyribonuclease VII large subunit
MRTEGLVVPDQVYSVSQITELVKTALEVAFPKVWVEGEISNYKRHTSGHVYFTLKDEKSSIRAVLFRSEARKVGFDLKDGLQIVCRGRISVYDVRGEYQLYADLLEPKGKGVLQLAFEQLRDKLKAEGLFDPQRKKTLPLRPRTIGVVTSPTGAAIRDILRVLERRYARLRVLIYPVRVQGDGASREIVEGLDHLGNRPGIEVIIVGRGGGSIEDLWAFNEESVARAIARSPVPVISAVGHEVDVTIADFVADVRASTPSAAAEMVIEKEEAFQERISSLAQRLGELVRFAVQEKRAEVSDLTEQRIIQNFRIRLMNFSQRVDDLETRSWKILRTERQGLSEKRGAVRLQSERLTNHFSRKLQEAGAAWERLSSALDNLSPLNVLKKGYALCWKDGGLTLVRRIEEIEAEDTVIISFHKGEFQARVGSVDRARTLESRFLKEGS